MKKWFSLSEEDQKDLIRVTAGRMRMDDGIIEKDVWLLRGYRPDNELEPYRILRK